MNVRAFLLFSVLLIGTSAFSQKYNIKNYTTRDGLAGQIVNSVFQDKTGYLWFATQSGVCYYNGRKFQLFEPTPEVAGIDAVVIQQDKEGKIWIGTNANGLFIYDFNKVETYSESNGLLSNVVRSVYMDRDSVMWVLTSKGVVKHVNNKFVQVIDQNKLFLKGVLSMTQDANGALWFGTQGNGLVKFQHGKYTYFKSTDGVLDDYIFSLATHGDSLLIGTTNQGLVVYHQNKFQKIEVPEIENAWISNMIVSKNMLNIVTSSGLVQFRDKNHYTFISETNGITSNDLYYGLKDRENNIWLTSGNGVSILRNEEILSYDKSTGLSDNKITCLASLKDGRMAIGTYGYGINILDRSGKVLKHIEHPQLMNVKITSIAELPGRNELWVGAEQSSEGVVVLDMDKNSFKVKRTIPTLNGLAPQTITKITVDDQGTIWIGSFNVGLFKIAGNDTINYGKTNLLPSNEVYTFIIDEKGFPWVSLYQKGIFQFDGNNFQSVSKRYKLKDKFVLSIAQDQNGNIFLGNKTEGLTIVPKNGNVVQYKTQDGLLSNAIQSVLVENETVWLGTDQGLNKLILNGNFKLLKVESYNEKGGLLNSEIQQNALLLTNAYIWIGSSSGLSRLKKISDNKSRVKPILEVQSIKLFFEDVNWKEKNSEVDKWGVPTALNLGYKDNHLTFSFNALTTAQIQFSYKLDGQDNNWTPFSDKNEVTFSNIAPGTYTFKVKAINNLGIVSDVLEIPIVIRSPYWQTWWFRITMIVILAIIIIGFIRYREKRYREQQTLLEETVQERTKEAVSASERAENQKLLVEQKNKEILDSIAYAKRIQTAMLPNIEELRGAFPELMVLYRPKDIVAGDFYWMEESEDYSMIAVADCTGHGVPGAIVSVVCYNALNRAVREYGLREPGKILDQTRNIILAELSKHDENVKDGMDISLVVHNKKTNQLHWSGANNPLWIIKHATGELMEIKADKQPIGMHIINQPYTTHLVEIEPNDMVVMFTDGYSDQFGGVDGKKFKSANFKRLLLDNREASINQVETALASTFDSWKNDEEQVDDVCVMVFRV